MGGEAEAFWQDVLIRLDEAGFKPVIESMLEVMNVSSVVCFGDYVKEAMGSGVGIGFVVNGIGIDANGSYFMR